MPSLTYQPTHSPQRKEHCTLLRTPWQSSPPCKPAMLLPVVCPLLITPGQCAEFIDKESEDLAGV
nr:MAG TPA: hypothetical protein [Caudoviricetes sp.]